MGRGTSAALTRTRTRLYRSTDMPPDAAGPPPAARAARRAGALRTRVPADAARLAALRAEVRAWLATAGLPPDGAGGDVLIAVGELTANAVEHAHAPDAPGWLVVELERRGDAVRLRVADDGAWRDGESAPGRGRGLAIVRRLAGDVAIERSPAGTAVTATIPAHGWGA